MMLSLRAELRTVTPLRFLAVAISYKGGTKAV